MCAKSSFSYSPMPSELCASLVRFKKKKTCKVRRDEIDLLTLISIHFLCPAAAHQRFSRKSQTQPGLPRGCGKADQRGQQYHTWRDWSAWQDGEVWRRKKAVCNSKWKKTLLQRTGIQNSRYVLSMHNWFLTDHSRRWLDEDLLYCSLLAASFLSTLGMSIFIVNDIHL